MKILNKIPNLFKKRKVKKPVTKKFGWKRDLPDHRDLKFKITAPVKLPTLVDLRHLCPSVYSQGNLGSCTANALGAAYQYGKIRQGKDNFMPSRLFIYYNERAMEGTINEDAGAMIRDGIKTMIKDGVCPEIMWEYIENKFKTKPCPQCYETALDNQIIEYLRITPHTLYEIKHCLSDGYPVVFGFTIYESFMSEEVARTGIAPIPNPNESPMGGHAVLAIGYDDSKECLIVRNSWGVEWGIKGYFYLPYWYITTLNAAADFWTIRLVE